MILNWLLWHLQWNGLFDFIQTLRFIINFSTESDNNGLFQPVFIFWNNLESGFYDLINQHPFDHEGTLYSMQTVAGC